MALEVDFCCLLLLQLLHCIALERITTRRRPGWVVYTTMRGFIGRSWVCWLVGWLVGQLAKSACS